MKMKKAFLHTHLQKQIATSLSTFEAAHALQQFGANVDRRDSDWMPFEVYGEDYRVEGVIERWAGTESRIRYEGEITLVQPNEILRNWLTVAAVVMIVILCITFVTPLSIRVFGTEGMFTFINIHLLFALIVAIMVSSPTVYLIKRDPQAQRRWEAQQRLGQFRESLEQVVTKD